AYIYSYNVYDANTYHYAPWSFDPALTLNYPYPYAITNYVWDFGDGSPLSTSPAPRHVYTTVGVFIPMCTLTTANGCTFSFVDTVKTGLPPFATVTSTPTHACAGYPITFIATKVGPNPIEH